MGEDINKNTDFKKVLEIILLFLKNNHFEETSEQLRKECKKMDISLSNVSGTVLYNFCQQMSTNEKPPLADKLIMLHTYQQKKKDMETSEIIVDSGNIRNQFQKLHEDYTCLLDVTFKLTHFLQTNLDEQAKNLHSVLTHCECLHPSLFQPLSKENITEEVINFEPIEQIDVENFNQVQATAIEVTEILESIVADVFQRDNSSKAYIHEVAKILEDILQEAMISPRQVSSNFSNLNNTITKQSKVKTDSALSNYPTSEDVDFKHNNQVESKINEIGDNVSTLPFCEEDKKATRKVPFKQNSESETKTTGQKPWTKLSTAENRHIVQKNILNVPKTPLCYLEICRKIQDGCPNNCRCMKCVPGQSRYYCSCYEEICKEVEGESEQEPDKHKNVFKNIPNRTKYCYPINVRGRGFGEACNICKQLKCKCAFQSRPRIRRSPPV